MCKHVHINGANSPSSLATCIDKVQLDRSYFASSAPHTTMHACMKVANREKCMSTTTYVYTGIVQNSTASKKHATQSNHRWMFDAWCQHRVGSWNVNFTEKLLFIVEAITNKSEEVHVCMCVCVQLHRADVYYVSQSRMPPNGLTTLRQSIVELY